MKRTLKILSVGNSFSVDTMEHVADIALACGFDGVKLGNLYIAGLTFFKALTDLPVDDILWAPDGVDAVIKRIAIASANAAIDTPFAVTAQT